MENFIVWILWAAAVFFMVGALTVLLFAFADPKRVKPLFRKLSGRKDPEK